MGKQSEEAGTLKSYHLHFYLFLFTLFRSMTLYSSQTIKWQRISLGVGLSAAGEVLLVFL